MAIAQLHFITGNQNKLAEVQAILGQVVPLYCQCLDLTEIQGTIEEISRDKCSRAAAIVGLFHLVAHLADLSKQSCPRWVGRY